MAASFTFTAAPAIQSLAFASATATFSATSIGTAAPDRIVVVGVGWDQQNQTVSSVTIDSGGGPVSMTAAITSQSASAFGAAAIYYLLVPTGATATIAVTLNAVTSTIGIQVGIINGSAATPSATGITAPNFAADPMTLGSTLTVPIGGVGFVVFDSETNGHTPSVWDSSTTGNGSQVSTASGNTQTNDSGTTAIAGSWTPSVHGTTANGYGFAARAMAAAVWSMAGGPPLTSTIPRLILLKMDDQ